MAKLVGSAWVEGNDFHYISSSNEEWFFAGTLVGAVESYPGLILSDGPVAYWRLGELSGTSAVDLVAAQNGVIAGGVTLGQAGAIADGTTAMLFNGTTGKVTVANAAALQLVGDLTIEFWINAPLTPRKTVVSKNAAKEFHLVLETTGAINVYQDGTSAISAGGAFVANVWQHIVVTRTAATKTVRFYVNGVAKGSNTYSGTPVSGTDAVSISSFGGNEFVNGLLDEVALYPVALTASQVAAHYTKGIGNLPKPGSTWIEGNDLHYINQAGTNEYKVYGPDQGVRSSAKSGSIWIETALVAWIKEGATNKYLGHDDVAHVDSHSDVAHVDGIHTDVAHTDSAHTDTHTDTAHVDTHGDAPHSDSHTDSHDDVVHSDSHTDVAHSDSHVDGHGDAAHTDIFHVDEHGDATPHGDSEHVDVPEENWHGDSHDDVVHSDVAHGDQAHTDSHGDSAHGDAAHADTHTDAVHTDSHEDLAHTDVAHSDVAHADEHTDSHVDTGHTDKPTFVGP